MIRVLAIFWKIANFARKNISFVIFVCSLDENQIALLYF